MEPRTKKLLLAVGAVAAAGGFYMVWRKRKGIQAAITTAAEGSVVLVELVREKLPWSKKPSPELMDAITKACVKYGVPLVMGLAVARNESTFNVGDCADKRLAKGYFRREKKSWEKRKNQKIPGSDKTWADFYTAEEWGSYGAYQTLPFHFVGKGKPLEPGEPLCKGHDPYVNADVGVGLLAALYKQYGNWVNALAAYNAGPGGSKSKEVIGRYVKHIAEHLTDLGKEARALLPETIAGLYGLRGLGSLQRRSDSAPVRDTSGRIVGWAEVVTMNQPTPCGYRQRRRPTYDVYGNVSGYTRC